MFEEKIILLVKTNSYDEAITIFVEKQQFNEAEQFCNQRPRLKLMTNLFRVYIKQYMALVKKRSELSENKATLPDAILKVRSQIDEYKK